jgi:hypothetical protein
MAGALFELAILKNLEIHQPQADTGKPEQEESAEVIQP